MRFIRNMEDKGEEMMDSNGGYGFVSGLFIGATLGAMAALLLAPKSGREVRADLYAGGERLRAAPPTKRASSWAGAKRPSRWPKTRLVRRPTG